MGVLTNVNSTGVFLKLLQYKQRDRIEFAESKTHVIFADLSLGFVS